MYKSIDLFAGIGGIRLGFEQAFENIETVFVSEIDANAQKTYKNAMVTLNNSMYIAHSPDYELQPSESFKYKENQHMQLKILKWINYFIKKD